MVELNVNVRHRDIMSRIIQLDDYVIWSNGKYGQTMQVCQVMGATEEKLSLLKPDGRITRVYPNRVCVITAQVAENIRQNVGANA